MRRAALSLCFLFACNGDDTAPPSGGTTTDDPGSTSSSTGDESSSGGLPPGNPHIEATIDATAACNDATSLAFEATRFACVGGGPCTIPDPPTPIQGTTVACPTDAGEMLFSIELTQGGRYHVELVATLPNGSTVRDCYSADGSDEVVVGTAEVNSGATITVMSTGSACPP